MLSWRDDEDATPKRPLMTKAGSLPRTGTSFETRTGIARKSVDTPAAPGGRKSSDTPMSPASSLTKANSLLRGPGLATEGTIGSEGWWHHMDHSQMNEPAVEVTSRAATRTTGFMPQTGITGQSRSLWADETSTATDPARNPAAPSAASAFAAPSSLSAALAAASAAPQPSSTAPVAVPENLPSQGSGGAHTAAEGATGVAPSAPGAASSPPAPPAPVASAPAAGGQTFQPAAASGWWAQMDNGILNQPAEAAPLVPGAVVRRERVMGGGFTPQFGVAGGHRYGSIFDQQLDTKPLEQQVASWGPFQGQEPAAGAAPAAAAAPIAAAIAAPATEDGWSTFTAAPN